ncbi:hypothetical protein ACFLU3_01300 [Chloroflexota bacterium]
MEIQAAPGWWKAVAHPDGTWDVKDFGDRKLAIVEAGEDSETHARMFASSAYLAEALVLLLTAIGDEGLPDNGYYNQEDRTSIKDMALTAVKTAMGNDQWNWKFGLGLEESTLC